MEPREGSRMLFFLGNKTILRICQGSQRFLELAVDLINQANEMMIVRPVRAGPLASFLIAKPSRLDLF